MALENKKIRYDMTNFDQRNTMKSESQITDVSEAHSKAIILQAISTH